MIDSNGIKQLGPCKTRYIPPKPQILIELQALMNQREADVRAMSALISRDVGLSAAVLRNVNSAFFGMKRLVSDIRQAVVLLGPQKVTNLVSAYEMRRTLSGGAAITMERFWDSAERVAQASALLGKEVEVSVPVEDLYSVGLFHDCGIPLMAICFADYLETLKAGNADDVNLTDLEFQRHGINHAMAGYMLTDEWGLPTLICDSILQHHEKDFWSVVDQPDRREAMAVLMAAEKIVDKLLRSCDNPEWSSVEQNVLGVLGLTTDDYLAVETTVIGQLGDQRG